MSAVRLVESDVEEAAAQWLSSLGYGSAEIDRDDYSQVVLKDRLRSALYRLNPTLPLEALIEAYRKVTLIDAPNLVARNHAAHRLMVDGVNVEYRKPDGSIAGAQARVIDYAEPDNNDWLVTNQFTVVENKRRRRFDLVVFVNGLPLVVMEFKNPAGDQTSIWSAYQQLQTYKQQIPSLFVYNAALVVSDGVRARIGTLTASREWFMRWRTITGEATAGAHLSELQVLLEGVLDKRRFLDIVRHFLVFENAGGGRLAKKMAGYHQYHAVNVAVQETLRAAVRGSGPGEVKEDPGQYLSAPPPGGKPGDRRVGVIWHTQGSGKSLSMAFYAGKLILHPEMRNPTIVVMTDRNDLDDQLFSTFSRCRGLLRQTPVQAENRADLRSKLAVDSGGVVFTTIQKFFPEAQGDTYPELSSRQNIVVIADEAHRSQYDFIDGFARHMRDALPNASFIGFTGTPIELTDKNTRTVFGDYISVYDIQRAVADGATVPIYYESRLAKIELNQSERPRIDTEFEEVTEDEEASRRERLKTRWAQLEALVGAEKRIALIAKDIVSHFEDRLEAIDGKAMVVCMSRRICVELYAQLVKLLPDWHSPDDDKGAIKVVMTASASDPEDWQQHSRSKARRELLAHRFRDPDDPLKIVLVRDMWLTGFDCPSLHTMYVDKPMQGHGLMQSIARVNRVYRDKPGGLIVDYIGLADQLRRAMVTYTESGGTGNTAIDQEQAVFLMQAKYEVCKGLFHGLDWSKWTTGDAQERLALLPLAQEHILNQPDGKQRCLKAVTELSRAFALAVPHPKTKEIRDDLSFFQHVRAVLAKAGDNGPKPDWELDAAIKQIVSDAIASDRVIDIFEAAGLKKPDISILSDEFLATVRDMPRRNLAVELLRKLLTNELQQRSRRNVVQARSFSEMLEQSIRRYHNRAIETVEVITELIDLARQIREADRRGEKLDLSENELAFYDALETNDSAVRVLGDETLRTIARELTDTIRNSVTIDWAVRESARARMRVIVKRLLRKHNYPPDKQEKATQTVLQQAEVLCEMWGF